MIDVRNNLLVRSYNIFSVLENDDDEVNSCHIESEMCIHGEEENFEKYNNVEINIKKVNYTNYKRYFKNDRVIGLDSMAEISIFNKSLIVQDWKVKPIYVNGINKSGSLLKVDKMGVSLIGCKGYTNDNIQGNILSLGEVKDTCHYVNYDTETDMFLLTVYSDGPTYIFKRENGGENLYLCNIDEDVIYIRNISVLTVKERMKEFSKREVRDAILARQAQIRLGFYSSETMIKLLKYGKLLDCEISIKDIQRADYIFGQDIGEIKGKSTASKGEVISNDDDYDNYNTTLNKKQSAHGDLMFVNGRGFLINVFIDSEYVMVTRVNSKKREDILAALKRQFNEMKKQGFVVSNLIIDGEKSLDTYKFKDDLNEMDINLDVRSRGVKVKIVERKIRTIKERLRALVNSLPFELNEQLEDYAVLWAVNRINMCPTSNSVGYDSPREKVYGKKINIKKDAKHGFGDYVQIVNGETDNTLKERSRGAIAIMPTGYRDGSWYYYCLDTLKTVKRVKAIKLPMPNEVIERLNDVAKRRVRKTDMPKFRFSWNEEDDNEDDIPDLEVEYDSEDEVAEDNGYNQNDDSRDNERYVPRVSDNIDYGVDHNDIEEYNINENDSNDIDEENLENSIMEDVENNEDRYEYTKKSLRSNTDTKSLWRGIMMNNILKYDELCNDIDQMIDDKISKTIMEMKITENMTVEEGIQLLGDKAIESVVNEMLMLILDKKAFYGIDKTKLSEVEIKRIISSKMFLKMKYNSEGEFDKLKARLVAGGHQQDRSIYNDGSNPTVSTCAVFICAAIAAAEDRSVAVIDFPGAFVNSHIPEGHTPIYMKLNKFLTMILCKIDSSYNQYVLKDGTSVVRLSKALYGCIESGKMWYDNLTNKLKSLGYVVNIHDMCVFNKTNEDGSQTTIVIHVDDIKLTTSNDEVLEQRLKEIETLFGEVTIHRGKIHSYLGMTFDYSRKGSVKVTMKGFIDNLLNETEDYIKGTAETPATNDLFKVNEDTMLNKEEKELFHTLTYKLLYLSKRVRPDILVATSYLTRRVTKPSLDDMNKLHRVIKYLRNTRELGITLEANTIMEVLAYIDSSHGIHDDMRSHTGSVISLGSGPIYAKSSRQKINTKSSAEGELVGLSDSVGQVVWVRNFVIEQGYKIERAKINHDNKAAITLIENGKSNSERSRHISIRYFFVHDRIKSGEIKLQYLNTEEMIADILTKPLQGSTFKYLRNKLLNIKE